MELFTAVFLVFMVGSGELMPPPVRSAITLTEDECWEAVKQDAVYVENEIEARRGYPVFVLGMCIPEERRASLGGQGQVLEYLRGL